MFSIEHPISQCPFVKSNLVTKFERGGVAYDTYTCERCGSVGRRYGFSNTVSLKKPPKCPPKADIPPESFQSVTIEIATARGTDQFGFVIGQRLQTVPSPEPRFAKDVWVHSQARGEAVRLLPHEYNIVL